MKIFGSLYHADSFQLHQKLENDAPSEVAGSSFLEFAMRPMPNSQRRRCEDLPVMEVYIDGSFSDSKASWAFVAVQNNKVLREESGLLSGPILKTHQVGGELKAAMEALSYARSQNHCVHIYYDYQGVFAWIRHLFGGKAWKTNNEFTRDYAAYMTRNERWLAAMTKVKAHSGNTWNDRADTLCTQAISSK